MHNYGDTIGDVVNCVFSVLKRCAFDEVYTEKASGFVAVINRVAEVHILIRTFNDSPSDVLVNALVEGVNYDLNRGHHVLGDVCHRVRIDSGEHWTRADAVQRHPGLLLQLRAC